MNLSMKHPTLFPNFITAFGLACGLFVIFKMTISEVSCDDLEVLQATAIFLLLAGLADLLDGIVARFLHAESDFGVFFDSISDAITFGVAPSVVVIKSLGVSSNLSYPLTTAAMIFTISGVLRLVRYSVRVYQVKENDELIESYTKHFTGLPIPAAATSLVSANLFLASNECHFLFYVSPDLRAWILVVTMTLLGYLMVSRWKFPSLKVFRFRIRAFPLIFFSVSGLALLFYGVLNHLPLVFMVISWGYVLIGWGLSIARALAGRRAAALEGFEPEEED